MTPERPFAAFARARPDVAMPWFAAVHFHDSEAAAEMTAFAKSTRNAPGLYLLVDVGALTLDACMFRLKQNAHTGDLYAFMAAEVRPLGVESFHWFLAEKKTEPEFVQQCERMLRAVVWNTKRVRDPHAECWKPGNDCPFFLPAAERRIVRIETSSSPSIRG